MRLKDATKGEIIKGSENYPYEVINDKVRIRLDFSIDLHKLTQALKSEDYYVANDPDRLDSQGWGKGYDAEGFYPYWVYEEKGECYFAFPPEDYKTVPEPGAEPRHIPVLGSKALEEFFRWLPFLKEAKRQPKAAASAK